MAEWPTATHRVVSGARSTRRIGRVAGRVCWAGSGSGAVGSSPLKDRVNGDVFERFVRDHLCPNLRRGDIVIWRDRSVHKRPELRALIESARGGVGVAAALLARVTTRSRRCRSKVTHLVRRARADTAGGTHRGAGRSRRRARVGRLARLAMPRRLPDQSYPVALYVKIADMVARPTLRSLTGPRNHERLPARPQGPPLLGQALPRDRQRLLRLPPVRHLPSHAPQVVGPLPGRGRGRPPIPGATAPTPSSGR